MTREHAARDGLAAGIALAALLWAIARPPVAPPEARCGQPSERQAEAGWSTWVSCDPETPFRPLRGAAPLLFGQPLDLNGTPPRALEVLPGIGPARAGRIARERERAPFASMADVVRVHGIGPGLAGALAGWAEACPARASPLPGSSQKSFQSLSDPCENSYKRRAGSAGFEP